MEIAVCIKQVPLIEDVNFDFESKTIKRDGPNVISAFDLRAIALAVDLKGRLGGGTTVITMGPPQAREALLGALAMGIDRGVHIEDRGCAGADTLATARALARWLEPNGFDLIVLGKYTLDAETGQVGPEVAELLGIAQITGVRKLAIAGETLRAERESDEGFDLVECRMPALLTCAERLIAPIKVTPEVREDADAKPVEVVRLADLGGDAGDYGIAGSPTWVEGVNIVEQSHGPGRRIDGRDPASAADETVRALKELGLLDGEAPQPPPVSAVQRQPKPGKDVWIACETDSRGDLTGVSLELATRGGEIADDIGGALGAILIGADMARHAPTLADYGVDQVFVLDIPASAACSADTVADACAGLVAERRPWGLFLPATATGRDWGPRLAARLGLGLTGDAIGLEVDDDRRLIALKPAFGGNLVASIYSRTYPQMATVRPGMLRLGSPVAGRKADVITLRPRVGTPLCTVIRSHSLIDHTIAPLERADTVIGLGMGIGGPDGVEKAKALARLLGASLCATRRVCDKGWLPRQLQVGLTGKGVNARLYIAAGVRGAPNHTVGLKGVGTIVAINTDAEAPIFDWADIGVVGDCATLLPALAEAFRRRRAQP
ncbi:MAG: FAD-binding protein [Alphaproteobacteria bacterium]|nr:FAD-binding protein [Alphaproteobacteria bacterium]